MPEHVFVETNFVVDWAAPAHLRVPEAVTLVERAGRGEIVDGSNGSTMTLVFGCSATSR